MVFLTFVWQIKTTIRYEEEKVSVPAIRWRWFGMLFDDFLLSVWSRTAKRLGTRGDMQTGRMQLHKIPQNVMLGYNSGVE